MANVWTSGRTLVLTVLLVCAGQAARVQAQDIGDGPSIFQQVGNAINLAAEVTRERAKANAQIAKARHVFFQAYRTGTGFEQAEKDFADWLLFKDLHYLGLYIAVGPNSDHPAGLEAVTGGPLDGGIRPGARAEFNAWLNKVRKELGAEHENQLLFIWDPGMMRTAVEASEREYLRYKAVRDKAEFEAMGIASGEKASEQSRALTSPSMQRPVNEPSARQRSRVLERHTGASDEIASEEAEVFVVVDEMPELIGGLQELQRRVQYTDAARRAGLEGQVIVQFVVDTEGKVSDAAVVRGLGAGLDEEAVRAVRTASFKPGRQRGAPVRVRMTLPITFQLE